MINIKRIIRCSASNSPDNGAAVEIRGGWFGRLAAIIVFILMIPGMSQAANQVTLQWDANNPAPEGYRLFQRLPNQSYDYSNPVWSGTETICTIENIPDGTTCHFVVRAYEGEQESGNSNEATYIAPGTNQPPIADAGEDQTVISGSPVALDGSGSYDPDGDSLIYNWQQNSGPSVQLSPSAIPDPVFTAPIVSGDIVSLVFELTVSDGNGGLASDTCTVLVQPSTPSDSDGDGVNDDVDAFPQDPNEWIDTDGDGQGNNADQDDDGDGVLDSQDAFPLNPNEWRDTDGDGIGNNADTDDDNDGVSDNQDAFPLNPNEWRDTDGDGTGNNADTDDDNDGVLDNHDAFPLNPNEWLDTDRDGTGNNADTDDDGDGMPDNWEETYGLDPLFNDADLDSDGDGLSNFEEYQAGNNPVVPEANNPPEQPLVTLSEKTDIDVPLTPKFDLSNFLDPDVGDYQIKSQWRIIRTDNQRTVLDQISSDRFLSRLRVQRLILDPQTSYICEARHFDRYGLASQWSAPVSFTTTDLKNDKNNNGVLDTGEPVMMETDLNRDGISDSNQEDIIRRVINPDTFEMAGISIEASLDAEKIIYAFAVNSTILTSETGADGTDIVSDYGVLGYKVEMIDLGQTADIIIYFPQGIDPQTRWSSMNLEGEVTDCTESVEWIDPGLVAIRSVTDGGEDDADGTVNGSIVEFLVPEKTASQTPNNSLTNATSSDSASVEAGGCFISSILK